VSATLDLCLFVALVARPTARLHVSWAKVAEAAVVVVVLAVALVVPLVLRRRRERRGGNPRP